MRKARYYFAVGVHVTEHSTGVANKTASGHEFRDGQVGTDHAELKREPSLLVQPGCRIKLSAGMPKPVCSFHTMAMVSLRFPLSTS